MPTYESYFLHSEQGSDTSWFYSMLGALTGINNGQTWASLANDDGSYTYLFGSGFEANGSFTALTAGTINYMTHKEADSLLAFDYESVALAPGGALNIDAAVFWNANYAERHAMVFAGNDTLNGDAGNNFLGGGPGGDTLDGKGGTDTADYFLSASRVQADLMGGPSLGDAFNDVYISIENLRGTNDFSVAGAGDILSGDNNNNTIEGLNGDDFIQGRGGDDTLSGGNGSDTLWYTDATNTVFLTLGAAGDGVVTVTGLGTDTFDGFENVVGGSQGDAITGNDFANRLEGLGGDDILIGGGGLDTLLGGDNNDLMQGGPGDDTIDGGAGENQISFIDATGSVVVTLGGSGSGSATAPGLGTDTYDNIQNMEGGAFGDHLEGNDLANKIYGRGNNDTLFGWGDNDTLYGDDGNDTLEGGAGGDSMNGGAGLDIASYQHSTSAVTVVFAAGGFFTAAGDAIGDTFSSIENIVLSEYNDVFVGGVFAPSDLAGVAGLGGDDTIITGTGNNALYSGGDGNDTVSIAVNGVATVIRGDAGSDTVNFQLHPGPVNVDMAPATTVDTTFTVLAFGQPQTIYGDVENITGSNFGDIIRGNLFDNTLDGYAGVDTLEGGAGNDRLLGGIGIDTADYSSTLSNYTVVRNGVLTTVSGPDGTDHLTSVETLHFTDTTLRNIFFTGDFNGDGLTDIPLQNGSASAEWLMNGQAIIAGSGNVPALGTGWFEVGAGNFDYNVASAAGATSDFLLQNGQQLALWEMNGTTIQPGSGLIGTLGAGWMVAAVADLNGDHNADILLQNGQQLALWQMIGTAIQVGSGNINPQLGAGWAVAGTGDFNDDGKADILLQNGQQLALWEMNGTSIIAGSGNINQQLGAGWMVAGVNDFNHDGKADILLQNGQQLAEWLMNGTALQAGSGNINQPLGAGWAPAGTGDFNHDGNADILLQNGQQLAEWLMNGTALQPGSGNINPQLGAGWDLL